VAERAGLDARSAAVYVESDVNASSAGSTFEV